MRIVSKSNKRPVSPRVRTVNATTNTSGVFGDKTLARTIRQGIVEVLSSKKGGESQNWTGTLTELDRALRRVISVRAISNWPGSPSVMRRVIDGVVSSMRRTEGVRTKFYRTSGPNGQRVVEFVQR